MHSHFPRIFRWHIFRYLARHRLLALLNIFSVALGVAVYLATQIANQSANNAFAATIDVVAGKADLEITAPAGNLPETLLATVTREGGIANATPLLRRVISLPDWPGEYLDLLGIDIFTNERFSTFHFEKSDSNGFDVESWLRAPNTIAISAEFAKQHNLRAGEVIHTQLNGVDRELCVGFVMPIPETTATDPHFAAIDIGWAQELFARRGTLSSIQLRLQNPRERESMAAHLRKIVPADVVVTTPARRGEQVVKLLGSFELNLTAMSLVALLVGMFLIYNTVSASVVRRRREIGILRSLGMTRREVHGLFLGEALLLGAVGSCVGLIGGVVLGRGLIGTVAGTISSLYVLVNVNAMAIQPWMFGVAFAIGVGSVLIAAWIPARAAANVDPVRALNRGTIIEEGVNLSSTWLWCALVSIAIAAGLSFLALASGPAWLGFGAAFFVLLGFSLIVPAATTHFSRLASHVLRILRNRVGRRLLEITLAAENLPRALMRNSITIAALAAAIAMTVGVSVMVFSFRETVGTWVNQTLIADLFIAPASNEITGPSSFIPPEALQFLSTHEGIRVVNTFREIDLLIDGEETAVAVVDGAGERRIQFIRGDRDVIMPRFQNEQVVIVSESFARRRRVRDGDSLKIATPDGIQRFMIAGTFYDYTRDSGVVYISQNNFVGLWHDDRVSSAAVYLKDKSAAEKLSADFRAQFSRAGQFVIFSNSSLRQRIFEIFDQTFAVTYVLRTIAIVVAVLGIFLGLTSLISERSCEFAVVRAIGGSAAQVRRLLLWESGMVGLLAGGVGTASGICLSIVLTGVINRAFFGWTIHLAFPWRPIVVLPVWIIVVAIAAAYFPAARAGRMQLAETLRSE